MNLFEVMGFWTAVSAPVAGGAGYWLRSRKKPPSVVVSLHAGQDEFLREENGKFVATGEAVPEGVNPVLAARQRTRAEGIRYETRRIGP